MKSILFYWGKGASTRVMLLNEVSKCGKQKKPCFLSELARKLGLSHVAVKKHVDLLLEEGYAREINPGGKPVYLEPTEKGLEVLLEFKKQKTGQDNRIA
jgi:DNA-binding MarR family transcriptional regulator